MSSPEGTTNVEEEWQTIEKQIKEKEDLLESIPNTIEYFDERDIIEGEIESLRQYQTTELFRHRSKSLTSSSSDDAPSRRPETPPNRKRSLSSQTANLSPSVSREYKMVRRGVSPERTSSTKRPDFSMAGPSSLPSENQYDQDYKLALALQEEEYDEAGSKSSPGPSHSRPSPYSSHHRSADNPSGGARAVRPPVFDIPKNIETIDLSDDTFSIANSTRPLVKAEVKPVPSPVRQYNHTGFQIPKPEPGPSSSRNLGRIVGQPLGQNNIPFSQYTGRPSQFGVSQMTLNIQPGQPGGFHDNYGHPAMNFANMIGPGGPSQYHPLYPELNLGMPGGFPSGPSRLPGHGSDSDDFDKILDNDWEGIFSENRAETEVDIQNILENIHSDEHSSKREPTPAGLNVPLHPHQQAGLHFLKTQEEGKFKGSLLCDDMGLGKTIQVLSLMLINKSDDPARKTNLVIAPLSLLRQWEREIKNRIRPGYAMKGLIYHGPGKKKYGSFVEMSKFDVVLTTYGTLGAEYKKLSKWREQNLGAAIPDKSFPFFGVKSKWYRVILDEAQYIKNKSTQASNAVSILKSTYKLALSGTPIQNTIDELYSYLRFLGTVHPYNSFTRFKSDFSIPLKSKSSTLTTDATIRVRALIASIMLRRTKEQLFDGKPILQLPPKHIEIIHTVFSEDEKSFYDALEARAAIQINKYVSEGSLGENYSSMLVLLLRLRQACLHPHLNREIKDRRRYGIEDGKSEDQKRALVARFPEHVVARLKEQDREGFECPVCYDASDNPQLIIPCGHDICIDCFNLIMSRQDGAEADDGGAGAKCPTCRGELKKNMSVDYASFVKVHLPKREIDDLLGIKPDDSDNDSDENSDTSSGDEEDDNRYDSEGSSLGGFIVSGSETENAAESSGEDSDLYGADGKLDFEKLKPKKGSTREVSLDKKMDKKKDKGKVKGKQRPARKSRGRPRKNKILHKPKTMADERKEAQRSKKAMRKYMEKLSRNFVSSSKIDKAMEILETIRSNDPTEKTLIFSQFTSFLDLVQIPLYKAGYKFERFDGTLDAEARNRAVEDFTDKPEVTVMLISMKAGNVGLNLTRASQVIALDVFFNPWVEEQAFDRAHRLGQEREVYVHRIIVPRTVEDRILELQDHKREMVKSAMGEEFIKSVRGLSVHELGWLFGIGKLKKPGPPMIAGRPMR